MMWTFVAGMVTGAFGLLGMLFILGGLKAASDYDDEVAELYRQRHSADDGSMKN